MADVGACQGTTGILAVLRHIPPFGTARYLLT